jgi:hypothetical protein
MTRDNAGLLLYTVAVVLVALWLSTPGWSHDAARPELDGWFQSLHSGKGPCCDGAEALRIDDADWASVTDTAKSDVHYKVRIQGEWVDVPDDAVVEGPNRAGPTMVWPYFKDGHPAVRCFMPGQMA